MVVKRGPDGRFVRTRNIWDSSVWDDGYLDNRGRFRVYRPDYPRAYQGGYALRAHVVWWLENSEVHPIGMDLHHRNGIKDDDGFKNLVLVPHGEHSRKHNRQYHSFVCECCDQVFVLSGSRVATRRSEGNTPRFCSLQCYHRMPRTKEHKLAISNGLRLARAEGRR